MIAGGQLPTDEDLNRLKGVAGSVYLAAMPVLRKAKKDSEVERFIRKHTGKQVQELCGWGQVRARRQPGDESW
jgi:hypothetical protein